MSGSNPHDAFASQDLVLALIRTTSRALNRPLVAARETLQVGDDARAVRAGLDTNAVAQALGTRKSFRR